jgi:RNA polymerase subunit RPABC4/transcription elongation factor Spt4
MTSPEVFGIMSPQEFTFIFGLAVGAFLFYRERISVCHECERIDSGHSNYCEECGNEKEQRYAASVVDVVRSAVGTIFSAIGEIAAPEQKRDSR